VAALVGAGSEAATVSGHGVDDEPLGTRLEGRRSNQIRGSVTPATAICRCVFGRGTVPSVTSVWAESARLPFAIFKAANRHARQLGRAVVSDDLFLLALTELDEDQPARRALAAAGVSSERLLPNIRTTGDAVRERLGEGLHYAPAYYTLQGLAQGFAATLGDGVIAPEHVLLAIQWTGNSHSLHALQRSV
jgi:hypothetical protein